MISAEPAKRVREMAECAVKDAEFVALLCDGSLDAVLRHMERLPDFKAHYQGYLLKFGDRCLDELKLESETLHDDPLLLLRSTGQLARRLQSPGAVAATNIEAALRREAEQRAQAALSRHPLRRMIFRWVLRQARLRVRERENLRFERTRLFGKVRRIFLEIGRHFHALDLIASPRDIFYLEVEEVLGFIEGTATTTDLKSLVALRRAEFAEHHRATPPADRFETRSIVNQGNRFQPATPRSAPESGEQLKGIGCCPGIVRGPVRVVTDPRDAVIRQGEILVAERTDPGWIMLFPAAAGLLVERGSLLSHSAIVAREMGIPAIVSLAGVTQWLKDGDFVEFDGGTGVVRRCEPQAKRSAARSLAEN
jgi:pyruvate,water dikinase